MAEEAGVDRASIRDWLKQKEELLKKDYKRDSFRLYGAGKKPITLGIEEELIKFIIPTNCYKFTQNYNKSWKSYKCSWWKIL